MCIYSIARLTTALCINIKIKRCAGALCTPPPLQTCYRPTGILYYLYKRMKTSCTSLSWSSISLKSQTDWFWLIYRKWLCCTCTRKHCYTMTREVAIQWPEVQLYNWTVLAQLTKGVWGGMSMHMHPLSERNLYRQYETRKFLSTQLSQIACMHYTCVSTDQHII